jgi:hypothetical protein
VSAAWPRSATVSEEGTVAGQVEIAFVLSALGAWFVATMHLIWVLRQFIPAQAALLTDAGRSLPPWMHLRLAIALLEVPIVPAGLATACGLVASFRHLTTRRVWRILLVAALAGTTTTVSISFGVIYSVHFAVEHVVHGSRPPRP